jgi:hypothetical protein
MGKEVAMVLAAVVRVALVLIPVVLEIDQEESVFLPLLLVPP